MFASIKSATLVGITGTAMNVEVHIGNGLPGFTIVGTPDEACRESRDRVRAALLSSGFSWPSRRITVNLARSGQRKGGAGLDLAIAVAVLVVEGVIPADAVEHFSFIAELGLDGRLRTVPGVVPLVAAVRAGTVVTAPGAVPPGLSFAGNVVYADNLAAVIAALVGDGCWTHPSSEPSDDAIVTSTVDLSDVKGQPVARFALEVAAAGAHHILLFGPPGSGKTMLANRLPTLLPPLVGDAAITATLIHSAAGLPTGVVVAPPFRAPHHSSSTVAMIGGGDTGMRPGEVSLATSGVLFLDEMGEFAPATLDALRQPLEEGVVRVARARASITLPAKFLLVGSTNPCPCGGGAPGACVCDESAINRYLRRLSGPLLDRFDLRIALGRPAAEQIVSTELGECSASVRERVSHVRGLASARGWLNADIPQDQLDEVAPLSKEAVKLLRDALESGNLTGRGYHRVRRVGRTIADIRHSGEIVQEDDIVAALSLRQSLNTRSKVKL